MNDVKGDTLKTLIEVSLIGSIAHLALDSADNIIASTISVLGLDLSLTGSFDISQSLINYESVSIEI